MRGLGELLIRFQYLALRSEPVILVLSIAASSPEVKFIRTSLYLCPQVCALLFGKSLVAGIHAVADANAVPSASDDKLGFTRVDASNIDQH
jgi:hypothetical protein